MANDIFQVIKEAHAVGVYVLVLGSDFGMRDVMRCLGFRSTRDNMVWKIPHPCVHGEFLHWMPDPVHAFKTVSGILVSREEITIATDMVQEQDLPSDTVHKSHFERLIKYQEDMDYSHAHKLK